MQPHPLARPQPWEGAALSTRHSALSTQHSALGIRRSLVPRPLRREGVAIFGLVAVPGLVLSYLLAFVLNIYSGDALSRTYQAMAVFYNEPARLANMSFIWTPLPSFVQLPLVLIPALALNGYAGQIVSVFAAAGSLVLLNALLRRLPLTRAWRYVLLVLYQLNPMVFIFTVNGMTESLMIFWVLYGALALYDFGTHPQRVNFRAISLMGVAAGMAFLTRYEGVSYGAALAAVVVLFSVPRDPQDTPRLEARLLAVSAPWVYAMFFWVLMNGLMMGDPLYFMTGRGSNREQAAALLVTNARLAALLLDPIATLRYVALVLAHLYPAFFIVCGLLLLRAWRAADKLALALALVTLSFPAFQALLHYAGQSFGWMRFHIYVIPLTVFSAAYLATRNDAVGAEEEPVPWNLAPDRAQPAPAAVAPAPGVTPALLALAILLVASSVVTGLSLSAPDIETAEENTYARALTGGQAPDQFASEREMGVYLRALLAREPGARILLDDLHADYVVVFAGPSRGLVGTRDPQFRVHLSNPAGTVQYVLASDILDGSDQVATRVASVADAGEPFALVHRVDGSSGRVWSLYRVSP